MRNEVVFAGEAKEARMKADDPAVMFGHGGSEVVIGDLTRDASQFGERMNLTANEGPEARQCVNSTYIMRLCAWTRAKAYSLRESPE